MKYTVTKGSYYAAYEPAEGGYYYTCAEAHKWITVKSRRAAKKYFNAMIKKYGFQKVAKTRALDEEARTSKYIGDGQFIVLEKGCLPHERGRQVYC